MATGDPEEVLAVDVAAGAKFKSNEPPSMRASLL